MVHIDWARLYAEYDCLAIGVPFTNEQLFKIKGLGESEKVLLVEKWRKELEKGDTKEAKKAEEDQKEADAEAKKLAKEAEKAQEAQEVVAEKSKNQKK